MSSNVWCGCKRPLHHTDTHASTWNQILTHGCASSRMHMHADAQDTVRKGFKNEMPVPKQ